MALKKKYSYWIQKHIKDSYVLQAKKNKIRSRSWFKLAEINNIYQFIKNDMTVIDLGSAPGSWSQYAIKKVGNLGKVMSFDLLAMKPIKGVFFFQGDCRDTVSKTLLKHKIKKVSCIISDMSPNISGISIIDIPKSIDLAELALIICHNNIIFGGNFLVKVFQGQDFKKYIQKIRSIFNVVHINKPKASRSKSKEVYILAQGYKYNNF